MSGGVRTGSSGDGRLGDCLDAADRQGEGVYASTTGLDEEDYRVSIYPKSILGPSKMCLNKGPFE